MYRVRRNGTPWHMRWPWRLFWPQKVNEKYCSACNMPFIEGPLPKPNAEFGSGNVAALLYPGGDWQRKRYAITIGRWQKGRGEHFLSEFIPSDELRDTEAVIVQVREYLDELAHGGPARRTVRR